MENALTDDQHPEIKQYIERNYRFNFIVNALDGSTYWFAYSFIAPTIILPLYIAHFTSNPILIGLIPFINTAGYLIPQLFTSNYVERAPLKKYFPVNIGFFTERIPVFFFPVTVLLFARSNPVMAMATFLLLYAWYSIGAGLIIVGWQDLVAKIIPVNHRGRFFGITNFVGTASGILGALAVTWVLEKYEFPQAFLFAFIAAAILIFLSWVSIALTREPPVYSNKPRVSQLDYLRSLPRIISADANFRSYLITQIMAAFSQMASGFLIVFATRKWNLPDADAGGFIIAMQVGQALANLLFGFLADRKGHKLNLEISALINAASLLMAIFAPVSLWFYPIFFLRGALTAVTMLSGISIVLEFSKAEDRPTYIGLANTVPGVVSSLAPLFGGWLAGLAGYPLMFGLSTAAALIGFGMLRWGVREPRFHAQTAALPVSEISGQ